MDYEQPTQEHLNKAPTAYDLFRSPQNYEASVKDSTALVEALATKIESNADKIDLNSTQLLEDPAVDALLPDSLKGNVDARKAMLANVASAYTVRRKSGELYPAHPAMVGMILENLYGRNTVLYVIGAIHDSKEEGAVRDAKNGTDTSRLLIEGDTSSPQAALVSAVNTLNAAFPKEYKAGYRAMLTMEPEGIGEDYMGDSEYAVYTRLMEQYGDPDVWAVALVDKATNVFGRYGVKQLEAPKDISKAVANFAKYRHMAEVFMAKAKASDAAEQVKPAYDLFNFAWERSLAMQQGINKEQVDEVVNRFYADSTAHQTQMDQDITIYLQPFQQ